MDEPPSYDHVLEAEGQSPPSQAPPAEQSTAPTSASDPPYPLTVYTQPGAQAGEQPANTNAPPPGYAPHLPTGHKAMESGAAYDNMAYNGAYTSQMPVSTTVVPATRVR